MPFSKYLLSLFIFLPLVVFSQHQTKMYAERNGDATTFYIDNKDIYPVTISFDEQPVYVNMKKPEFFKPLMVIPANARKFTVAHFSIINKSKPSAVRLMPGYTTYLGDVTLVKYDADYIYDLPFKKGASFLVYQGYNGTFSHQNDNAIDFVMPVGTEITAAREGLVIDVMQDSNTGCAMERCADLGNAVAILHADGTVAKYFHLQFKGARVNKGDMVLRGQTIGLSGNTGFSSGPHLHFECHLPTNKGPKYARTIKTLFKTGNGKNVEYLKEKTSYSKNY